MVTWLAVQHVVAVAAVEGSFGMTLGPAGVATWQDSRGSSVRQQGACLLSKSELVCNSVRGIRRLTWNLLVG